MFPSNLKQLAHKSSLETIPRIWGEEAIVVNCDKYCGKLLYLGKNAISSYHYHKEKQETFYALQGLALLTVGGRRYTLSPFAPPRTVMPTQTHSFQGITDTVILEISTHHSDDDVVRLLESKSGC